MNSAFDISEATVTPSLNDNTADVSVCPTCGGSKHSILHSDYYHVPCPTCHGTGRQSGAHSACEEGAR